MARCGQRCPADMLGPRYLEEQATHWTTVSTYPGGILATTRNFDRSSSVQGFGADEYDR